MNQVIKGLIWDIDGLLVDTEWLHFLAWNNMVKEAGGKTLSEEEYRPLVGHGWEENMKRVCRLAGISGDDNSLNKRRQMHYANLCDHGIPVIKKKVIAIKKNNMPIFNIFQARGKMFWQELLRFVFFFTISC